MEKTQNRCLFGRGIGRDVGMSVVLLSGRKIASLWFGRYHQATSLPTNMRFGLAMLVGSHRGRNSAPCPH
jgi:hypothetical protein